MPTKTHVIEAGFETPLFAEIVRNLEQRRDNAVTLCVRFCGDDGQIRSPYVSVA